MTSIRQRLLSKVMVLTLLLSLSVLSLSCCRAASSRLIVRSGEVEKMADGRYAVTAGWMAHQLKIRAALQTYIERNCK